MSGTVPPSEPASTSESQRVVSILLVDDNASKRLAIMAVLRPLGHSIVEADSGEAALRRLMERDFAIILLDVRMPGMSGLATAALVRKRRQSELTPIIFLTAYASDNLLQADSYAEGAIDFISMPVRPDVLRAKVAYFATMYLRANELAVDARKVRASADNLRVLTDSAPIGIFQTDVHDRFVYTNPRWSGITGIPSEAARGARWDTVVGSEERTRLGVERAQGTLPSGEETYRFQIRPSESASRIVMVTSRPVPDPAGGTTGWVGTLADVTAESGAEAAMSQARDSAREASRLKSDFLANVSHEIRTPINGVLGMTDLLLETDLDTRQRDYAQTVQKSGRGLLTIIDDILDFSKIEAGHLQLADVGFDLRAVLDAVVDLFTARAREKGLVLRVNVHAAVPAVVRGDPGRVRQVLTNLISNALKFSETGEIVARVTIEPDPGDDLVLRFEITDTGDGIAADKLATIFQPFVQVDTSTTRRHGGTGLGLAISSQLVDLMGGRLHVASRQGEGSNFWFTICLGPTDQSAPTPVPAPAGEPAGEPAGPATDNRPTAPSAPIDPPAPITPPAPMNPPAPINPTGRSFAGRLLLAEDNLINQKVAFAMLSGAGYQVDTAVNGALALRAVTTDRYDAILMDCQMPELDGLEATAAIRRHEGASRRTPIIALTAGARREDEEACLAAGMDGYLCKPVTKQALLATLALFVGAGLAR